MGLESGAIGPWVRVSGHRLGVYLWVSSAGDMA